MDVRIAVAVVVVALSATARADHLVHVIRDGFAVRPGPNDAHAGTSTIAKHPVELAPWTTTDETWQDTLACLERVYAPFAVTFTEDDPGDVPYIALIFGGSPLDLGLPRNYAGVSPFADDCSIIERSIVFTFTEILPGDAATACRVAAQELGHSYGLDHELSPGDPMSVQPFDGERGFTLEEVPCGEDTARPCGLPGATCRMTQSSYGLLLDRLGARGAPVTIARVQDPDVGCSAGRGAGWLALALGLVLRRRR